MAGASASGSGSRASHEAAEASSPEASIPNASDYAALKAYGHSPAKAAEIVLDASRGDCFCERYVAFVRGSLAASAMSAGTAETRSGSGHQPASAVGAAETPK
jgi:hypothetical protein